MTGFEPDRLVSEETALPSVPEPLGLLSQGVIGEQCDLIGRFIALWATIILPKLPTF